MAKKKQPPEGASPGRKGDRHKPATNIRISALLAAQLEHLVERNQSDTTEEVRRAIIAYLEQHHLWPPPPKP